MKKVWKWIIGIVVALVVLAAVTGLVILFRSHWLTAAGWSGLNWRTRLPGTMPSGDGNWDGRGWYMMDRPGMMTFGWMFPFGGLFGGLFSLGLLALVVLGIVWLVRKLTAPKTPPTPAPVCAHCGKPVQAGWVACPYCGKKL